MNISIDGFAAKGFVVVATFNGFRGEDKVEALPVGLFVDPGSYCGEHLTLDFDAFVA
jgi:hypothetical protein